MVFNIGICDDEIIHREILSNYIDRVFATKSYKVVEFDSGEDILENYPKKLDILLLDVQMEGINGIEIAKRIRSFDTNVIIIFITAIIDFMQQGYEVRAFRYLLKPINYNDFSKHLLQCEEDINKVEKYLDNKIFYRCHRSYLINLNKVRCISKNSVLIKDNEILVSRYKLKDLKIKVTNMLGDLLC